MSSRAGRRHEPSFSNVVKELKATAAPPTTSWPPGLPLHPIEDGHWLTPDGLRWRIYRHLSSAEMVRETMAAPGTRVLMVDGPYADELSSAEAERRWKLLESDFKLQFRKSGRPGTWVDVAEFRDGAGGVLLIIEADCAPG